MASTIKEVFIRGKDRLSDAGVESPAFDALALLNVEFGIADRTQLAIHGDEPAAEDAAMRYFALIERRRSEPLQYILKEWEFDGMSMRVGKGVLIPREDTLTIVEAVQNVMANLDSPKILDLCAGSGAIGLALAHRLPDAEVVCLEKSDEAFCYLTQNIMEYGEGRVSVIKGDVLEPPKISEHFDCIVSNPPYILSKDIDGLQWEVCCEPRMALDGGEDGLTFYRAICEKWLVLLNDGGLLAFESGYDITDDVENVMHIHGITNIKRTKDINNIERCIFGFKLENNT